MLRTLDLLHRLHTRLLDIASTATPLITPTLEEADLVGLCYLRDEMVQMMAAYGRFIDEVLVPRAERSGDPELICRARAIHVGSERLINAYDRFCARWVHRDPMMNWPEYRLTAMLMIKQLREQVMQSRDWLLLLNQRANDVADIAAPLWQMAGAPWMTPRGVATCAQSDARPQP